MKIVVIMPLGEQRGGAELMFVQLLREAKSVGLELVVLFLEDGPLVNEAKQNGFRTEVIHAGRLRQMNRFGRTVSAIAQLLRETKVDAMVSWMPKAHLYGGMAACLAGIPAFWFQHGLATSLLDRVCTWLPARGIFGSSKAICASQARLFPHRPVRLVYPGVELARFEQAARRSPSEMREHLRVPADGPTIGIVGRLQRWKGMHFVVEAFSEVLERYPNAQCLIVGGAHSGEPDYPLFLQSLIARLGLGDRVRMVGAQWNVPEWMQAMDVVMHASDREPFGIVVIEAMALGKPVVASACGGPREVIQDGVTGLLAPYAGVRQIADAILRFLDYPDFAIETGLAAREVAGNFSIGRYAETFANSLREWLRRAPQTEQHPDGVVLP